MDKVLLEETAESLQKPIEKARKAVKRICDEKHLDINDPMQFGNILYEIDAKHDKRRYKCRYCKDSGIVSWIDPDDGMWYGRRCGYCRYWDEERERERRP